MSFGGFLGIGNQYHPLPWSVLKYDTNLAATLSISTNRGWKGLLHTTSAPNLRGAIALMKAGYTTITKSDPTGPCDVNTVPNLRGILPARDRGSPDLPLRFSSTGI